MKWPIGEHRAPGGKYDVVVMGATPGDKPGEAGGIVAPFAQAGAPWWLEPIHSWRGTLEEVEARIAQGPPVIG